MTAELHHLWPRAVPNPQRVHKRRMDRIEADVALRWDDEDESVWRDLLAFAEALSGAAGQDGREVQASAGLDDERLAAVIEADMRCGVLWRGFRDREDVDIDVMYRWASARRGMRLRVIR